MSAPPGLRFSEQHQVRSRRAVAILSVTALLRFADRLLDARTGGVEALFPSPSAGGAPSPGREQ